MDIFKFELKNHDMVALGKLDRNKNYSSLNALSYVNINNCSVYARDGKKIMFILYSTGTDEVKAMLPTVIVLVIESTKMMHDKDDILM